MFKQDGFNDIQSSSRCWMCNEIKQVHKPEVYLTVNINIVNLTKKNNLIELRYHVLRELKYRKCLHHEINQSSAIIPILNKVIDVLMLS